MDVGLFQNQENELHLRTTDLRFFLHDHRDDDDRGNVRGGDGRLLACHGDDEAQCYEPA